MKILSISRSNTTFIFCVLAPLFLYGCQSTPEEEPDIECRETVSETCAEDNSDGNSDENGDDRGYNPCLVNKKLPVCKK